MVVIFFNLGLVLAFILLVSIVFINASTKFVLAILGVICILFLIKDIIQDLYFALYKYKNNVLIVIISFAGEANGLLFGMGQKNESSILMNVFMTGCLVAFCHFII